MVLCDARKTTSFTLGKQLMKINCLHALSGYFEHVFTKLVFDKIPFYPDGDIGNDILTTSFTLKYHKGEPFMAFSQ